MIDVAETVLHAYPVTTGQCHDGCSSLASEPACGIKFEAQCQDI